VGIFPETEESVGRLLGDPVAVCGLQQLNELGAVTGFLHARAGIALHLPIRAQLVENDRVLREPKIGDRIAHLEGEEERQLGFVQFADGISKVRQVVVAKQPQSHGSG
jgi:hypothetical protein